MKYFVISVGSWNKTQNFRSPIKEVKEGNSPAAFTTPPIHFPAASNHPLQFRSAWAHFSFLQLSHLSAIFLLQFSFSWMTLFLASESFFWAASKAPLTALAAASNAWKKWQDKLNKLNYIHSINRQRNISSMIGQWRIQSRSHNALRAVCSPLS